MVFDMTRRNYWPIAVALLMLLLLAALLIFQFRGSAARENQLGSSTVQDADTLNGLQTELDAWCPPWRWAMRCP